MCRRLWAEGRLLPQRRQTRADTDKRKSRAGRRTVGLPAELVKLLHQHREDQAKDRANARQLWIDDEWVFTAPDGGPVNPSTDYHDWKSLLKRAGLRDSRLHDARHTAATVLLILGVSERAVMSVMGWATTAMAARYQHVTDPIRQAIAMQLDGLIFPSTEAEQEPHDGEQRRPGEDTAVA